MFGRLEGRQPYPCWPLVPLTGRCTQDGERNCWFHCLPAPPRSNHQPTRAPAPHTANTVALRGARAEEGRIRQPSNNMGHLQSDAQHCTVGTSTKVALCFHTWKQSNSDFESFKPCLPTLILTSSQPRRTQLAESNTDSPHIRIKFHSVKKRHTKERSKEKRSNQLTMAGTPVNHFNIGDWVESERDDTRGL